MYRVSPFVRHFARALLGGVGAATLWVNLSPGSYYDFIEYRLLDIPLPAWVAGERLLLTPMSLVSDGLMSLFLFFIGKELWEALVLKRGALSGRQALLPAGAVAGGIIGTVAVWLVWSSLFETAEEAAFATGWQVAVGSDVVICYVVGRLVFGAGHAALHLLLLLAIAFDIAGLLLLGLSQPARGMHLLWLLLTILAVYGVWKIYGARPPADASEMRRRRGLSLLPYVIAAGLSWFGVAAAGLSPALGLLPVIAAIPHADRAFGLFAEAEEYLHDPLNRIAHALVKPLAVVLFLFGLTRGGIDLLALAPTTGTTLAALWIGKPLGLMAGAILAGVAFGLRPPSGVSLRDFTLVAAILGIGFTVPVLAIDTALPGGAMAEAARLGLALSLAAAAAALLLARLVPPSKR